MKIKKILPLFLALLLMASGMSFAGDLTLGARAGVYNPPEEGAKPSFMYGFTLDYGINAYLHARADASYTSYAADGIDYTLMPVTINLIAHFLPGAPIDPYLGGGVGYYSKTKDGVEFSKTGAQAMAGFNFKIGGLNAAFEAMYIVPDLNHSDVGSFSWGGSAAGTTYVLIPF
jgi:hypothetical protein